MTRNNVAAGLALISAVLFIVSGYQANIGIYRAIESVLQHYTSREIWQVAIIPINVLAIVAQLGGFAVLAGALLFLKNRITSGKLLVMIGTGQGIITIVIALMIDLVQGGEAYANSYVLWLSTSASGLGILFSIIARTLAKPIHEKIAD
jgi:hypothetical protein